ncbi:MAG: ABC transporter substrate-binding protein [bacterium]
MHIRYASLLAAALTAALICGCGEKKTGESTSASAKTAQPVAIEMWHYFAGDHEKAIKELADRFMKENPGISVRTIYQGRPPELSQKLAGALAASPPNNPAVSTVYETWTSDYVSKGYLDAAQDHFAGPDGMSPEEQDDIIKGFREACSYDGKMVTLPFNKSIYVLYLNMDKLAKAGFTTAPKTLQELKDAVIKTTVEADGRVMTFGMGMMPTSEAFTTLFFASGGEYLNAEGKMAFDSEEGLAALGFLKELHHPKHYLYVSTDYMNMPFGNEQVAMFIYSSASFPYNEKSVGNKFKWEVAPIPGLGVKTPRYVMQGTNIGIFKNKSEAERAAAWKLVKFLASTPSQVYWIKHTGYMPIRYSMLKNPEMMEYLKNNPRYAAASSLVLTNQGKQEPKLAVWDGIRENITQMVDQVLSKGADPKQQLAATQAKAQERVDRAAKR